MTKRVIAITILLLCTVFISPGEGSPFSFGITYMAGIRYDDVRMCVATDAGVKGGPIGDIQFTTTYTFTPEYALTFNLPFGRPLLFASAFDMLQFEPEFTFEYRIHLENERVMVLGPGLGISLNHGPGYEADLDNRGEEFFASGPFISGLIGWEFTDAEDKKRIIGIRAFYVPLNADDHPDGRSYGAALEYTVYF